VLGISGKILSWWCSFQGRLAMANLYLLKRGLPAHPKKCSEVVVEPFDDGWPEYEERFTLVEG
jgi:hypothetical protein